MAVLVAGCVAAPAGPAAPDRPAATSHQSGRSAASGPSPTPPATGPAAAQQAPESRHAVGTGPRPSIPGGADGRPVVVLDPGHNGGNGAAPDRINRQVPDGRGGQKACNTTGTATDAGYPEHAFNWDVAGRVSRLLVEAGVEVVLTRTGDDGVGPCVDERGQAGERADADVVVSIHADGSQAHHSGFHVALSDPPLNAVQQGPAGELALALRDAMRAAGFPDSDYAGRDGLSPRDDLAGLNHATRPTVLVECANMRNAREAGIVSSSQGRQRYADAIAAGVLRFLS